MKEPRKVGDLLRTRRDLLRLGRTRSSWRLDRRGCGRCRYPSGHPAPGYSRAERLGTFSSMEMSGAISHVDSYDFKESAGTAKDLATTQLAPDLHMSQLLLPKMSKHMDKIAVVRSMQSHEEVHFRAQYYLQTGRQMNLAFAREIPAIGSVIAAELEERRASDRYLSHIPLVQPGEGFSRGSLDRIPSGAILGGLTSIPRR